MLLAGLLALMYSVKFCLGFLMVALWCTRKYGRVLGVFVFVAVCVCDYVRMSMYVTMSV